MNITKHVMLALVFSALVLGSTSRVEAVLSYNIEAASGWPSQGHYNAAVSAIESSLARYNAYAPNGFGNYNIHVRHDNGVPTAQAGYLSSIQFGGTYPNERVMLHEIAHYLGSGTLGTPWDGQHSEALVDQFDGLEAQLNGDGAHFWPYGLNFDSEGSEINKQRNVALMYAQRADMGIGPSTHPSTATTVQLTGSDPLGTSGFNYQDRWSDGYFAHAGADYFTGDFLMRTPNSGNSFTFVGDSLMVNNTNGASGGLSYHGSGTTAITRIENLTLDNGYLRHASGAGDLFQLDGSTTLIGSPTIDAAQGSIKLLTDIGGTGSLNLMGRNTVTLAGQNTYAGATAVASGTTLTLETSTGAGGTSLARGARLWGAGTVGGNLLAAFGSTVRVGEQGLPKQVSQMMIDDFESYGLGLVRDVASPPWTAHGGTQFAAVEASGRTRVLTFGWSGEERATSRRMPDQVSIGNNDVATIFFRVNAKSDDPDHNFGLGDQANTDAVSFDDFGPQVRFRSDALGTFAVDARNGGRFTTALASGLSPNEWYNMWMVIDQTTDTYDLFMNTGIGDAEAAHQIVSGLRFRRGTTNPLDYLLAYAGSGGVDYGVRIDDIAYLQGVDLTNPLGGLDSSLVFASETLTVEGDFELRAGATLALDLADTSAYDRVSVGGSMEVAGTLQVSLESGAPLPQLGDLFQLLNFGSATGSFEAYSMPALDDGLAWNVSELLVSGELSVVQDVDLNDDGVVNGQDFLLVQSAHPELLPAWESLYGSRLVTPMSGFLVVPEPTVGMLLTTALVLVVGRPRSLAGLL